MSVKIGDGISYIIELLTKLGVGSALTALICCVFQKMSPQQFDTFLNGLLSVLQGIKNISIAIFSAMMSRIEANLIACQSLLTIIGLICAGAGIILIVLTLYGEWEQRKAGKWNKFVVRCGVFSLTTAVITILGILLLGPEYLGLSMLSGSVIGKILNYNECFLKLYGQN